MNHAKTNAVLKPPVGLFVIAATFSLNLLALALPLVMLQVFDRVIPHQSYETLTFLFLGLCSVAVLEFSLKWARVVLLGTSGEYFENAMTSKFVERSLHADPDAFQKVTLAGHLDRYEAIAKLRNFYAGQGRILSIDLPFTAVFIAMIGLIGGWLILVPLISIALLLGFRLILKRAQNKIFSQRKKLDNRRHSFLLEVLSQLGTIKAFTMEAQMLRRYELLQHQTVNISHSLIHFSGFSQTFGALFSQLAVAAMGLFGGFLIVLGQIGIAELAACMLLNGRTVQPLLRALNLWVQSENLAASHEKLEAAFHIEQRPAAAMAANQLTGLIRLENVQVEVAAKASDTATPISTVIHPGNFVTLRGANGHSKTQFLKMLLAEAEPAAGRVTIDGRSPNDFANTRGFGTISYIDQLGTPFAGSVLENLSAFGDGDAIDRALALSRKLGIEKVIHRLPLGYNTMIQESAELSNNPTILQRICIVRALVLQPKILLLNKISNTLDERSRQDLASTLQQLKGKTTVIYSGNDPALLALEDAQINLTPGLEPPLEGAQELGANSDHIILFDQPRVA